MPGPVGGGRSGGGARGGGTTGGNSGVYGGVYGNRNIGGTPAPSPYNLISGKRGSGSAKHAIVIVVAFLAVFVTIAVLIGREIVSSDADAPLLIESVERTKLSSVRCTPIDKWLEDEAGLLQSIDEKTQVEAALAHFYEKTGVQPYLLMLDAVDGDKKPDRKAVETYLTDRYIELFGEDEGHYIFLYLAHRDTSYTLYYIPGLDAVTVVDDEVSSMLMDCIAWYYRQTETYGEMFANAFVYTAELITYPPREEPTVQFTKPVDVYGFGG
ncbi:MAG: TPM domain-containing protein [Ruminococcaceae bacterium]|nr:TPM domain-containing protein [Oscillospiraceae bacterium]